MAGYSFVSSSGITLAQMYVMKNKPINSMDDVVQILLGIGLNLGLILGITKANDKSDSDVWIMRIVALIRDKGLLPIVLKERQDYLEFIHKQITCWHKHDSNDKDTHFVGLIIRIHTDFFAEIVSATTVEENESSDELFLRKEKLKDLPQKIIRDYHFGDQNMTVLAQVKQLFNEYLDIANSEMFKVISFIKEHEQCCQGKIKARLKAQIESRVTPPRQKQTSAIDAAKLVQKLLFSMREVSATEEDRDGSLQS
ncbi:hypothetical protein [Desulfosporosinus sp. OT]|uniref:hypothetical protein n=1 Tax=Desulfosporosinus sp. OT TaxID=913865 RepID=UPI001A99CD39|nr:hypothetical protein [Desulfosporosinus sp. OT]